jgi:hypothetical protein
MAIFTKLTWPIVDKSAVCSLQDIASAGLLLLNGTLSDPSIVPSQISFINYNLIRSVSISSLNNLSARTFVINGFQNNAPVTDTISGPNNNTVYGTVHFDVITSVHIDGAANGVSVGTGDVGYLPLFVVNTGTTTINYSLSIIFPPTGVTNIDYSVFQTLDQINTSFLTFDSQLGNLFPLTGLINQTSSQIANYQNITNFILLKINSSGTPLTDTFDFVFLQT